MTLLTMSDDLKNGGSIVYMFCIFILCLPMNKILQTWHFMCWLFDNSSQWASVLVHREIKLQ